MKAAFSIFPLSTNIYFLINVFFGFFLLNFMNFSVIILLTFEHCYTCKYGTIEK